MSSTNLIMMTPQNWTNSVNLSFSDDGFTMRKEAALAQFWTKYSIPFVAGRTYKLSFDIKFEQKASSGNIYMCINPKDSHGSSIVMGYANPQGTNRRTTLAEDLKDGDTVAVLTDSTDNWTLINAGIGICDNLAWGWDRCTKRKAISGKNGNQLTLATAWSQGTIPAGTKVNQFNDGATYYYPYYWAVTGSQELNTWIHYERTFSGGDAIRKTCVVGAFGFILGTNWIFQIRNLSLECVSDFQQRGLNYLDNKTYIKNEGIFLSNCFSENSMFIRYIRDSVSGNSINAYNHLCQIKAISDNGINYAFDKKVNNAKTVATDGIVNNQYIDAAGDKTFTLDLQFLCCIEKIIIWHYYADGRTYYNNKVEVSVDGINWITVYEGQKPETSEGNVINLNPNNFLIRTTQYGAAYVSDIYEY